MTDHRDSLVAAVREWAANCEGRPSHPADAEVLRALWSIDGDHMESCPGCDGECDEPCAPCTVAQAHASLDAWVESQDKEKVVLGWHDRIANYKRELKYPICMGVGLDGRVFGIWNMGNDYTVKSKYYGGYPATYLKRVKALFPEKRRVLHLFSGHVDTSIIPGDTVDINPDLNPTYVDDAQTLLNVPLEEYDLILADPAYSIEDSEHYGTPMISRNKVFRALARCISGTHVVWLDQVRPMYNGELWYLEGDIGMVKSTNHRYRDIAFWCRI